MKTSLAYIPGVIVVFVVVLLFGDRFFPPAGTTRHNGHLYRVHDTAHLPRLEELRHLSLQILNGMPPSLARFFAMWRIRRCIFSERGNEVTTYLALTIDKGRELIICLDYEDENTLRYVLIHELAHVYTRSIGHTPEFYRNMDKLLDSARAQGLYVPQGKRRVTFCGTHVDVA